MPIPWVSLVLVAVCVVTQRVFLEHNLLDVVVDKIEFSGQSFVNDKHFWTPFTGSLVHSSLSHELNNLIFTFVIAAVLEFEYGCELMLFLFVFCGAIGWLASACYQRCAYGPMGLWVSGRGSSPNMYGMALFAAVLRPSQPLPSQLLALPLWFWCASIWILPPMFSSKMFEPLSKDEKAKMAIGKAVKRRLSMTHLMFVLSMCLALCCLVTVSCCKESPEMRRGDVGGAVFYLGDISASLFMAQYLMFCLLYQMYTKLFYQSPGCADHWAHLGGALAGVLCAVGYSTLVLSDDFLVFRNISSDFVLIFTFCELFVRSIFNV